MYGTKGKGFPYAFGQGVNPLNIPPYNMQGPHQKGNPYGRSQATLTGRLESETAGRSTDKIPPGWGPERQAIYPFKQWVREIKLWEIATPVEVERRGPLLIQQMTGVAKAFLMDQVETEQGMRWFTQGALVNEGQPNQYPVSGIGVIVRLLGRRFKEDDQQNVIQAAQEYNAFTRMHGETIDEALLRFNILHSRAEASGVAETNLTKKALNLLRAFKVPNTLLPLLLQHTQGKIPSTDGEISTMLEMLREWSRLLEPGNPYSILVNHDLPPHLQQGATHFTDTAQFVGMMGS